MGEQIIIELVDVLELQRKLYQELLEIAKAKQPTLVKGDLAALNEFTLQEEKIVVRVGKLEEQRGRAQQALANHYNIPEEEVTLQTLVAKVDVEHQGRLAEVGQGLKTILGELKNINSMNSELVQQSLGYIEFTVNVITGAEDMLGYPEKPGEATTEQARARIFDRRV